jgi:hypothetical protein
VSHRIAVAEANSIAVDVRKVGHGIVYHAEDPPALQRRVCMRRVVQSVILLWLVVVPANAEAATPVSAASATTGVATLELVDPLTWTGRSIPTDDGVYFRLCDRGSLRPCALAHGAAAARRQAFELALSTLRATETSLVVVALPQSATRSALLVFERDLLGCEHDALRATADRLYVMGGLVAHSETEDSLLLVKLRPSPGARSGR